MRKRLLAGALCGVLLAAISVDVAGAHRVHADDWGGHSGSSCEPATHLAYYDPRRPGQTVWDTDHPNGNNVFYVDDDPTADFQPAGNYPDSGSPSQDCEGTPVLRTTAYVAVTFKSEAPPAKHGVGYPWCPRATGDWRNPGCATDNTVSAGFYVAEGDGDNGVGKRVAVMPLDHP
jgi:hypothetical protein